MNRLAAAGRRAPDRRPDGALLASFLAARDEPAFAELVGRHAGLVWAACRRGLPDPADAEDAFQATFLVLVRRAGRLTGAPTVGPWLARVAALTARAVRRKNARRRARVGPLPAAVPDGHPPDLSLDVADLLGRLPARYRSAVALCCLQGLTHKEAAARLGCAEGTVSSLVSRGLAKLRAHFTGREPAAGLAALTAGAVPASLPAAAVRSAVAWQLAAVSAAAPPAVAGLAEGVVRMFWVKKVAAAGMVAVALVGAGVGVAGRHGPPAVAGDEKGPKPADGLDPRTDLEAHRSRYRASLERARLEESQLAKRLEAARRAVRELERAAGLTGQEVAKLDAGDKPGGNKGDEPAAPEPVPADAEKRLRDLDAERQKLAAEEQALADRRKELEDRAADLAAKRDPKRTGPAFVLTVDRKDPAGPFRLDELDKHGRVVTRTVPVPNARPSDVWGLCWRVLDRARTGGGPQVVRVVSDRVPWDEYASSAAACCHDAGFFPEEAKYGDKAEAIMFAKPSKPKAAAPANRPAIDLPVRRITVGGTTRVSLPGKAGDNDEVITGVSWSREDVAEVTTHPDRRGVTIWGRKAGVSDITLTAEDGHKVTVRVSVVDAVPTAK